jgi:hypothetical protein
MRESNYNKSFLARVLEQKSIVLQSKCILKNMTIELIFIVWQWLLLCSFVILQLLIKNFNYYKKLEKSS